MVIDPKTITTIALMFENYDPIQKSITTGFNHPDAYKALRLSVKNPAHREGLLMLSVWRA